MPYRNNLKMFALPLVFIACLMTANAQTIEKLELVLGPPVYNTDRHDELYYEARGNVYAKDTPFMCLPLGPEVQSEASKTRLGTYRIGVSYGMPSEFGAIILVRLTGRGDLLWRGYFKFDPSEDGSEVSWSYEGIVLHSDGQILADFTPLSKTCFGGRLTVYFLN